MKKGANRKRR